MVGLMGAGKTTVGRRLAERLGRPLRDSDADLEAAHGRTGRDIARAAGVAALHRLERDHLLGALAAPDPAVIAPAASVVDDDRCIAALATPFVAWLDLDPEQLAQRLRAGHGMDHRRALGADPFTTLRDQTHHRGPRLGGVADVRIDVGRADVDTTVEAIVRAARSAGAA